MPEISTASVVAPPVWRRIDPWFAWLVWWPLLWHGLGVVLAYEKGWWLLPVWGLVLPPLLCRMVYRWWPDQGEFPIASAAARRWWWRQQMQMPFMRVPWVEEILRLIPGVYPLWLRAWGGRVALDCIFAPQAVVTDREAIAVGHGAVVGNGCLVSGHLVRHGADGWCVHIAPVVIGDGVLVGARVLIGPGAHIAADEQIPIGRMLPPCCRWRDGRRLMPGETDD